MTDSGVFDGCGADASWQRDPTGGTAPPRFRTVEFLLGFFERLEALFGHSAAASGAGRCGEPPDEASE